MGWQGGIYIIDDSTPEAEYLDVRVDGERKACGAVPRDYSVQPLEMFAHPSEMELLEESDLRAIIEEQEANGATLWQIMDRGNNGGRIPTMDQNGHGYCWAYSTTGAVEAIRAVNNQPYVDLSAHAVAAIIKKGADQGGWAGLSAEFLREKGVPSAAFWKEHSRDYRRLATPEMYANAAKHRVTESWVDLQLPVYDQNLTDMMIATSVLKYRNPVAGDFGWWGHSVLICGVVWLNGTYAWLIRNSWTDGWGDKGTGTIAGNKRRTMGAIGLRVTGASAA